MTEKSESGFRPRRVAILGIGLLGGSVALALREHGIHVVGYSRRESSRKKSLNAGVVTEVFDNVPDACKGADIIVIASPVDKIAELAIAAATHLVSDALITDVGITKAKIVDEISAVDGIASRFVAAHPIAGSEKTGVENAFAKLFHSKPIVVTPNEKNTETQIKRIEQFWQLTGAKVVRMTPDEHDEQLAAISHVPHLMASLLAGLPTDDAMELVGSGWMDLTRVASGDPEMWKAICDHNAPAILGQLNLLIERIEQLKSLIGTTDSQPLFDWLAHAKARRDHKSASEP